MAPPEFGQTKGLFERMTHSSKDNDIRAAEYVLSLMDPDEANRFEIELQTDPDLRSHVEAWQENFASMAAAEIQDVPPPKNALQRLQSDLFGEEPILPWYRRLKIFEFAIGGAMAALVLLVSMQLGWLEQTDTPRLQAQIGAAGAPVQLVATVSAELGLIKLRKSGTPPEGRAFELWVIAGDGPPQSLGVIPEPEVSVLSIPDALLPVVVAGAVFAITDEPLGGSPSGLPTGAVLGTAVLAQTLTNL